MRVWTVGDPEPEDHPNVVAGDEFSDPELEQGPWHYRWEPPNTENGWCGGWWLVERAGDLFDWEDILKECGVLTEEVVHGSDS